jgi:glutamate dehydrogenase (NAD(P)+)
MGTNEQIMTWIMDTYNYLYGEKNINYLGCCTGKFKSQGGISGRTESTGLGCFYVLKELLNTDTFCEAADISMGVKGKKVIIQGYGNVGYYLAKFLTKEGAKVVGIIEKDSAIYNDKGFDPDEVKMHLTKKGDLKDFCNADEIETIDPTFIMRKKCDIFAPCAGDGTLNMHNAQHIKAKVVLEGANGPTTFKADQILESRGIQVIPDMLANVGGVTVSYFEWLKNLDHVTPGRMSKKFQEKSKNNLLQMLGYRFP